MAWAKNGEDWEGEKGREGAWVYRAAMSVWKPTLGGQGASWRSALAAKTVTEADDAGGEEKRKKEGRKGGLPLASLGKGGREGDEEEPCLLSLEARAGSGGAEL
uniref:Uncharacterized protein n=1 Tax=Oryza sativa subsp. japonica TaxID=39947 RepID=Q6Z7S8_ORYSJ|nr:hypothetical protein [Oryza sativa Japonica Group]